MKITVRQIDSVTIFFFFVKDSILIYTSPLIKPSCVQSECLVTTKFGSSHILFTLSVGAGQEHGCFSHLSTVCMCYQKLN